MGCGLPKCSPSEVFVLRTKAPDDIFLQPPPLLRSGSSKKQETISKFQHSITKLFGAWLLVIGDCLYLVS